MTWKQHKLYCRSHENGNMAEAACLDCIHTILGHILFIGRELISSYNEVH